MQMVLPRTSPHSLYYSSTLTLHIPLHSSIFSFGTSLRLGGASIIDLDGGGFLRSMRLLSLELEHELNAQRSGLTT